ncbi:flagellar hook-associated protein FlgL [Sulfurospirillum barnesii]|uniref:Flagellin n=1 Tax=Sulfurospirillum barnesii (strain ATCC 700032 / DSM 10660 / SES-3) TaxID=760154 RepID=I3XX86_SULBS|nr:flagellar hook-associated protein FlgL [Sulfurospirillum barnesii]AFL68560.1 flagellin/flagellar hook associated protein [Sulfurospirillum barnesii SES-3]
MRVTDALTFNNSIRNYRTSSSKLYDVNQQIYSGSKIQQSYQNTSVYIDAMRLNSEITTLEQSIGSSKKAKVFAQNTDTTLTSFTSKLDEFKTKLTQAANASNSQTSLEAIANDLEAYKVELMNLANTSINGQFLFSGSALSTKPISSDGTYNGNNENLSAVVGSGVELTYNVTGQSLFLGKDSDYSKVVSTNVTMYNQTKLYPSVMEGSGTNTTSSEVYLTTTDTIRDMIGDTDSDKTNDPNAVFYLSGRDTAGETFATKIEISSSSSVQDLLDSIGKAYGNTSTNKLVDVSMNKSGQIEIKDLKTGQQVIEMNIFGAVDRDAAAGTSGNANQTDVNDLLASSNVDIIAFNTSNYTTTNSASTISSRADSYNEGVYRIGYTLQTTEGSVAKGSTLLSDIMPEANNILFGSTNFAINPTTTVQNLMSAIEAEYSLSAGSVRIENGQIIADDPTGTLNATLTARNGVTPVGGFSIPDAINYTQRGFEKDGNTLLSNVSQVNKTTNEYATSTTKLSEVAGSDTLDGKTLTIDYKTKSGVSASASINLSNAGSSVDVDTDNDGVIDTTFSILDANGNPTSADNVSYKQLTDIISMLTAGTIPTNGVPTATSTDLEEYQYAIKTAQNSVAVNLDQQGRIVIKDSTASESKIELSMADSNAGDYSGTTSSVLSFMANDSVTIASPSVDIFAQLDEMIAAVRSGTFRMDSTSSDPRNIGIQNALAQLDHIADHVTKAHTQIGALSNALTESTTRAETLKVNVKTVQTELVGIDLAEAYLELTQVSNSYQAMLSAISKVNSMSLLDYM